MQESKSIFQIGQEFHNLEILLEETGGELTPEVEQALKINEQELSHKAEGYLSIIRRNEAEADIIANEIKRLQELKKVRENKVKALKENVKQAMVLFNVKKIPFATGSITLANSKAVDITDENSLPEKYITKKLVTAPDKTAIKKAIESGETIEGASIKESPYLLIK